MNGHNIYHTCHFFYSLHFKAKAGQNFSMAIVMVETEELHWRARQIVSLIVNHCALEAVNMCRMRHKVATFAMAPQIVTMGETIRGSMFHTGKVN